MQFMMLMIPNVYRGNKKLDPGFVPDLKKVEEMARFNGELGKAVKILSLNCLHHHNTGTREEWLEGGVEKRQVEKELTRHSDELARRRQELPWGVNKGMSNAA